MILFLTSCSRLGLPLYDSGLASIGLNKLVMTSLLRYHSRDVDKSDYAGLNFPIASDSLQYGLALFHYVFAPLATLSRDQIGFLGIPNLSAHSLLPIHFPP